MSEIKIMIYEGWEIFLIIEQTPRRNSADFSIFSAFAYIRAVQTPEFHMFRGRAPWHIPRRGFLYYDSSELAFEKLRIQVQNEIDRKSRR